MFTPVRAVLFADNSNVPGPVFVNVPDNGAEIVAEIGPPVLLTAIDAPPALLSVRVFVPWIVQPKVFVGLSNTNEPMVRAVSRLIMTPELRLGVANVAVLLAPLATTPPFQFPGSLQFQTAPVAACVQSLL
jgi:hypothetical protein